MPRAVALAGLLALLLLGLTGCATSGGGASPGAAPEEHRGEGAEQQWGEPATPDPLEPYNRFVFAFNDVADQYVLRPVAVAYRDTLPEAVRQPLRNLVGNLDEPLNAANHYLQGRAGPGTRNLLRFALNSTVGVLGLFDVAGAAGIPGEDTDVGITLGRWGTPAGAYLVLPLLGPSTVRDTTGLGVGYATREYHSPTRWAGLEPAARYSLVALNVVQVRVELLSLDELLERTQADPYIFTRESYLQNRRERLSDDDAWGDWEQEGGWEEDGGGWE